MAPSPKPRPDAPLVGVAPATSEVAVASPAVLAELEEEGAEVVLEVALVDEEEAELAEEPAEVEEEEEELEEELAELSALKVVEAVAELGVEDWEEEAGSSMVMVVPQ